MDAHTAMSRSIIQSGDILITITGNVGRVCQFPEGLGEANINQHIARIRITDRTNADARYVSQLLRAKDYRKYFERIITGLAYPQISLKQVRDTLVALPSLSEQRKIAAILSSVDVSIEKTEAVIEQLQVVKKAMMQELLTRGLPGRHTRFKKTELGEIPEEWEVVPLGNAGEWYSGGTPSKNRADYWSGTIPWVSPKDMKRLRINDAIDHVSESSVGKGTRLMPAGTILIVVRGMILAHSFPVAITTASVTFNQDIKALSPSLAFEPEYLLYWLTSQKDSVVALTTASSHGTRRIPTDELHSIKVPTPTRPEQKRIAEVLTSFDENAHYHQQELEELRLLKSALMSVLLTGEVRVKPDE